MRYLILVNFSFQFFSSSAQNLEIQTSLFYVFQPKDLPGNSLEGTGFSMNYGFYHTNHVRLTGGVEFQGNSWANHVLVNAGISYALITKPKYQAEIQLIAGNGLALFKPSPMYSFSPEANVFLNYITKRNNQWGIGTGIQYMITPAYETISPVYRMWTLPVHLRYRF